MSSLLSRRRPGAGGCDAPSLGGGLVLVVCVGQKGRVGHAPARPDRGVARAGADKSPAPSRAPCARPRPTRSHARSALRFDPFAHRVAALRVSAFVLGTEKLCLILCREHCRKLCRQSSRQKRRRSAPGTEISPTEIRQPKTEDRPAERSKVDRPNGLWNIGRLIQV